MQDIIDKVKIIEEINKKISDADDKNRAKEWSDSARLYIEAGSLSEKINEIAFAALYYRKAGNLSEKVNNMNIESARAFAHAGQCYGDLNKIVLKKRLFMKAAEKYYKNNNYETAALFYKEIADIYETEKMFAEAGEYYYKAAECLNQYAESHKAEIMECIFKSAVSYSKIGRNHEAMERYNKFNDSIQENGYDIKYDVQLIELENHCRQSGLFGLARKIHIDRMDHKISIQKFGISKIIHKFWGKISDYGENVWKFIAAIIITNIVFAVFYYPSPFGCGIIEFNIQEESLMPSDNSIISNLVNSLHYSIVIFTTLGMSDIIPVNNLAKLFVSFEVFSGYLLLSILIVIIGKRIG